MSFLGGAECSTAGNPLSQFSKHVQDDKSLQRDRLVGRGPGGVQESMRSQAMGPGQDVMMDEFLQQPNQLPSAAGPAPSAWAMDNMRRELQNMSPHNATPVWASEFDAGPQVQGPAMQKGAGFNPADFARYSSASPPAVGMARQSSPLSSGVTGLSRPMGMGGGYGMGMGMMGMQRGYAPMFAAQRPQDQVESAAKGKSRMVELDDKEWEAQFASLEQQRVEGVEEDKDAEANAAIERELDAIDRSVEEDPTHLTETDEFGDFESIWKGIQAETANARALVDEEAFSHINPDLAGIDEWNDFDGLATHSTYEPNLGDYMFEQHNPFQDQTDPFAEGVEIMDSGGNLSLAALAFEAAVTKDPTHVEAWVRLGSAQAQNEKETPAIRALEEALRLDPTNLEALMGLAVSYTNESYETHAYRTLERWVAAKYPQVITEPLDEPREIGFTSRIALHEKVTNLFLAAARLSPSGEMMDPDVQVGLGVLLYAADDFDKAVDCFQAALESTEAGVTNRQNNLHLLWNRLGATLANSGRSEEAIEAYERALALRPNFVRARYNLGVSCINMGVLPEAAGHLLGALEMHKVVESEGREKAREIVQGGGGGDGIDGSVSDGELDRLLTQNQSTNLYDTLRRVFTNMGRRDLTDLVGSGMDPARFRGEFDF